MNSIQGQNTIIINELVWVTEVLFMRNLTYRGKQEIEVQKYEL